MSLKEAVEKHFADVFDGHEMKFVGSRSGGRDGKTGQVCESLEFSSALCRVRIERSDGEINAQLWHGSWERWRYVRELSEPGLRNASIEDLLARVPDRPLSDEEMLERLAPHIAAALQLVENMET
jgi:hypothetical protein